MRTACSGGRTEWRAFGRRQVVTFKLDAVNGMSSVRVYIPKDLGAPESRQSVAKTLKEAPQLSVPTCRGHAVWDTVLCGMPCARDT